MDIKDVSLEDHRETLKRHPWNRTCPVCGQDCSTVALVKLVYRFEECNCSYAPYTHLIERVYHWDCIKKKEMEG